MIVSDQSFRLSGSFFSALVRCEDARNVVIIFPPPHVCDPGFEAEDFPMAHLWKKGTSGWAAEKLDVAQFDLAATPAPQAGDAQPGTTSEKVARLIRADADGSRVWALVASRNSDVRVNGRTVLGGLCLLADRDEIRTDGGVQYSFSTETVAEFPSSDRPVFCGRCRQQIDVGSPAVCCPGCGVWYNQSTDLPCFTYANKCTFCGHPTALDAGFSWIPEE